jgi:hypothetical protein
MNYIRRLHRRSRSTLTNFKNGNAILSKEIAKSNQLATSHLPNSIGAERDTQEDDDDEVKLHPKPLVFPSYDWSHFFRGYIDTSWVDCFVGDVVSDAVTLRPLHTSRACGRSASQLLTIVYRRRGWRLIPLIAGGWAIGCDQLCLVTTERTIRSPFNNSNELYRLHLRLR